jgi:hypothetical protein
MRALSSVAVVLGLQSCFYIAPTWHGDLYDCPTSAFICHSRISVNTQDIIDCYGNNPLPDVLAECEDQLGENYCRLESDALSAVNADDCCGNEAQAILCCENGDWNRDDAGDAQYDQWTDDIEADCDMEIISDGTFCSIAENGGLEPYAECPEPSKSGFAADFELDIDPALSYVDVDLGNETVYSTVDGWALAAPDPKRFLFAFARLDDFEAVSDNFEDNYFYMSADIELSGTGGSYTIPLNQDFELIIQGLRDSEEYGYGFEPQVSSGGTFNTTAGTWTYNYTQTVSGRSIEVHLEGELTDIAQ